MGKLETCGLMIGLAALCCGLLAVERDSKVRPSDVGIIYYANDTIASIESGANYKSLYSMLEASGSALALALREDLERDADDFEKSVRADMRVLRDFARFHGVPVAVFTNARAKEGVFEILDGAGNRQEVRFPVSLLPGDPVFADAPLAIAENFSAALDAVGSTGLFRDRTVVLVTKSHGSRDLALMPRVSVDFTRVPEQELLARLSPEAPEQAPVADWAVMRGLHKTDYWTAIDRVADRHGLDVAVVLRDACSSGILSIGEFAVYPASVRLFAHSGAQPVHADQIDYAGVFATMPPDADLLAVLEERVRSYGLEAWDQGDVLARALSFVLPRYWSLILFMPLICWCLWMVKRTGAGRRGCAPDAPTRSATCAAFLL